jgi:hypothetical protein
MGKLLNRAKANTTTTGTGTVTLGTTVSPYQSWASAGAVNGQVYSYLIEDTIGGVPAWEIGTGTYTSSGTTLSRTLIESSSGALLNLSGAATVVCIANQADLKQTYYSGVNTSRTYDPGVSPVALDSCSISIPASSKSRVFMVNAFVNFQPVGTHGIHANIGLDGAVVTLAQTQFCQVSGETARVGVMGPFPITVPGDSAAHTIDFLVADAGATGNLVFNQRYIVAQQVS